MRSLLPLVAVVLVTWPVACSSSGSSPGGTAGDGGSSGSSSGGTSGGSSGSSSGGAGSSSGGSSGGAIDAGTPPAHFNTLPVGATVDNGQLPTEAQCTAWVTAAAPGLDATETMPCNAMYNAAAAIPPASWLAALHTDPESDSAGQHDAQWQLFQGVTGNFSGSTDMILRWAACKWGIDEDVVRAEAVEESSWKQSLAAGCGNKTCVGQGGDPPASGAANYWVAATDDPSSQTQGGTCCPTKGILQVGFAYWYAYPYGVSSTAVNADYRMAAQRACMNGDIKWLDGTNGGAGAYGAYPPTDTNTALYGCMGHWDSGSWNDSGGVQYATQLQKLLGQKAWTTVSCQ
jgi:autotransporter family porin